MRKKGQLETFWIVIKILFAVILFFIFFSVLNSCTRLSAQGIISFNDLAETLNKVASDNQLTKKTTHIILDEDTAVIGFSSKADAFKINSDEGEIIFQRPTSCNTDEACMCLCRKGLQIKGKNPAEFSCDELKCTPFTKFDFKTKTGSEEINWENGFILMRTENEPRMMEIHIKKEEDSGKTILTVCWDEDCTTL